MMSEQDKVETRKCIVLRNLYSLRTEGIEVELPCRVRDGRPQVLQPDGVWLWFGAWVGGMPAIIESGSTRQSRERWESYRKLSAR